MLKAHIIIYIGVMVMLLSVTMIAITVVLLLYLRTPEASVISSIGSKIAIDHDGGADDAMAIFIALVNEKYFNGPQVISLTTTYGNVNESQVFINSQRILRIAERTDVPIYRGSTGPFIDGIESDYYYGLDGLGDNPYEEFELAEPKPEHAAVGLVEMSKLYEGNLTVVAIGSLTNIAMAIQLDSNFINRLAHLYVGACNIHSTQFSDAAFNAAMDPEAYYIVTKYATSDKVTLVPSSQVHIYLTATKEWRVSVLGSIQTPIVQAMNDFERLSLATSDNWTQIDPAVMGVALHDSLRDGMKYANNGIILCGEERGINLNEFTDTAESANVELFYSASLDSYKVFLTDIFSAGFS